MWPSAAAAAQSTDLPQTAAARRQPEKTRRIQKTRRGTAGYERTGPAEEPLAKYDVTFNSNHIFIADSDEHVDFIDHPSLENVGGVSSLNGIDIDSNGVLLFRKSEAEIVALSRECTHQGCGIDPFEEV